MTTRSSSLLAVQLQLPEVQELASNSYVIMVHKGCADRVADYLLTTAEESFCRKNWSSSSKPSSELLPTLATTYDSAAAADARGVRILDKTELTGVSQSRRGYFLLFVPSIRRPIGDLSPMPRQNISWVGLVQSTCVFNLNRNGSGTGNNRNHWYQQLGRLIWETCVAQGFNASKDQLLRVDCHPRSHVEVICMALQVACAVNNKQVPVTDDPFEGPIAMTLSQTKCSHRLTIVAVNPSQINKLQDNDHANSEEQLEFLWGLENRIDKNIMTSSFTLKLNQIASKEIVTQPCDHETGEEQTATSHKKAKIDPSVPLSRAYYKLDQAWNEYLQNFVTSDGQLLSVALKGGAGMDLGASPGGWTQILALQVGLKIVVAVDPAKLATRVVQLPSVHHLTMSLETADYATFLKNATSAGEASPETSPSGYSMLVCDASITYDGLIEMLLKHVLNRAPWCLPAVLVITLKFPFKTTGSIQKHVETVNSQLLLHVKEMAAAMYPGKVVEFAFRVVHLMANSDSERTMIAVFERGN